MLLVQYLKSNIHAHVFDRDKTTKNLWRSCHKKPHTWRHIAGILLLANGNEALKATVNICKDLRFCAKTSLNKPHCFTNKKIPSHSLTMSSWFSFDLPGSIMNIHNFFWKVEKSSIFLLGFLKQTEQNQNTHNPLTFHHHAKVPKSSSSKAPGRALKGFCPALVFFPFNPNTNERRTPLNERQGSKLETLNNSFHSAVYNNSCFCQWKQATCINRECQGKNNLLMPIVRADTFPAQTSINTLLLADWQSVKPVCTQITKVAYRSI